MGRIQPRGWQSLSFGYCGLAGLALSSGLGAIVSFPTAAPAQTAPSNILPDATLGTESSQVIQNFNGRPIEIVIGGAQRGQNLFHSFQEFSVSAGRGAYFFNPGVEIRNILARVTGNNRSDIAGILGTFQVVGGNLIPSTATLFLINPNGIIFGQNARLETGGSFVATTANAVQLGDRGLFSASEPVTSNLLTIDPSAFLFNQLVQQPRNSIESRAILQVNDRQSLLLLGGNTAPNAEATGNILLEGNGLVASDGRLEVSSVGSSGTIKLSRIDNQLSFQVADTIVRADISLTNHALVAVASSNGGGNAVLDGHNIILTGSSGIVAGVLSGSNNAAQNRSGNIHVNATGDLQLEDESKIVNRVAKNAVGQGGNVIITATNLLAYGGSELGTSTFGQGNAGNVTITVRDTAVFDGESQDGAISSATSTVEPRAIGDGGTFSLTAGKLVVKNGAQLGTGTFGQGNAGNVTITVRDTAVFDGTDRSGIATGAFSSVDPGAIGDGGNFSLTAGNLFVTNGALLSSSTVSRGRAGNLTITVRDTAVFDGTDRNGIASAAGSTVEPGAIGDGGNFSLTARNLFVTNGAFLSASTLGQGSVGSLTINVHDTLQANNGRFQTASSQGSGGNITIAARVIRLFGSSDITTSVFNGAGGGGDITLTANSIIALGDSDILAFAQDGRGGNITLNTRAFFGQNYRPAPPGTNPRTLNGNNRVDVNASGTVSGIITIPDTTFIQNSLTQLAQNLIDPNTLLANSCIVRNRQQNGRFFITGSGGLPVRPGDAPLSSFPTGDVRSLPEAGDKEQGAENRRSWKVGDPIVEPQGIYRLSNGKLVLSRECEQ